MKKQKFKMFTPDGHGVIVMKKGRHKAYIDVVTNEIIMVNPLPALAVAALSALAPSLIEGVGSAFQKKEKMPELPGRRHNIDRAVELERIEKRCYHDG